MTRPDFRAYVRQRLPPLGVEGAQESEVIEELALELEEHYKRAIRAGLDPEEAWKQTCRAVQWHELAGEFRSILRTDTAANASEPERKTELLSTLLHELRYGFRLLRKAPGFTITAILTIALGIGPNTAIFSALYGVFWGPTGIPDSDRISVLWSNNPVRKGFGVRGATHVSPREYFEWKKQSASFENFTAVVQTSAILNDDADYPERIVIQSFTPGHITMLGARMALGRDFLPEEGVEGNHHVVIISHRLWQTRYKGDPNILGRQLRLEGVPHTITGVVEPGWWDRRREPLWTALTLRPDQAGKTSHNLTVLGLRKPGVTNEQAQAEMDSIAKRVAEAYPDTNTGWTIRVDPFRNNWLNARAASNLWLLMATVSLVLLIACVNVANLLLARGASRQKEIAVRTAMGGMRWQVFRQLVSESLLLSALGGVLGVGLSWVLLKVFLVLLPPFAVQPTINIGLNPMVLLFTTGTTLLAGLIFGCAPAWQLARRSVSDVLKQGARSGLSHRRHRVGQVLVVAEFALALTLLSGAALVMRSYWSRMNTAFGVRTESILTFELPTRWQRSKTTEEIHEYNRVLLERIEAAPGVLRAAAFHGVPLAGSLTAQMKIGGKPSSDPTRPPQFRLRIGSPGFFDTFGVETVHGRRFTEQDRGGSMLVAMVNETLVKQHLQGLEPLAQELIQTLLPNPRRLRIVGVYRDIHNAEQFGGPNQPEILIPTEQFPGAYHSFGVRTARDPAQVRTAIAAAVHEIDPTMPMANVRTMRQVVRDQTAFDRFEAALYGSFAGLALLLASVGIYGLMAFVVSQRTPEMGVRMALGADRHSIVRMILNDGLKLAIAGLVLGAAGAYYAGQVLQISLYGSGRVDPIAFAAVAVLLVSAALVACLLPARRAARIDPMNSLRSE